MILVARNLPTTTTTKNGRFTLAGIPYTCYGMLFLVTVTKNSTSSNTQTSLQSTSSWCRSPLPLSCWRVQRIRSLPPLSAEAFQRRITESGLTKYGSLNNGGVGTVDRYWMKLQQAHVLKKVLPNIQPKIVKNMAAWTYEHAFFRRITSESVYSLNQPDFKDKNVKNILAFALLQNFAFFQTWAIARNSRQNPYILIWLGAGRRTAGGRDSVKLHRTLSHTS